MKSPKGKKVFIIGVPEYTNLGDSAISIAQKNLIKKIGIDENCIKEFTMREYYRYNSLIRKSTNKKTIITGIGGGNMGDEWFIEEKLRRKVLADFPKNKVIIFPQTIFYNNSDNGESEKLNSIKYYNRRNCCVIAREEKSFEIMKQLYPNANIMLTPDIVLSTTMQDYGLISQKRNGILWCMRNDVEKSMTDEMQKELENYILQLNKNIIKTDMIADVQYIYDDNRKELVKNKMQEFASSELVITDRLHGMVFAALTGTPCLVFGNYNHKVDGTYNWIKYLSYIKYVEDVEQSIGFITDLLDLKDCVFDNSLLIHYFDQIISELK